MYRIIYLSSAVEYFLESEINSLLNQSRNYNFENNITGVLLYIDGDFLQVIEGAKEDIINVFEKIKKDTRHKGIIWVFNDETDRRQFPDWSMGFCSSKYENLRKINGFENLDKKKLFNITDKNVSVFIDTFIKSHKDKVDFF